MITYASGLEEEQELKYEQDLQVKIKEVIEELEKENYNFKDYVFRSHNCIADHIKGFCPDEPEKSEDPYTPSGFMLRTYEYRYDDVFIHSKSLIKFRFERMLDPKLVETYEGTSEEF